MEPRKKPSHVVFLGNARHIPWKSHPSLRSMCIRFTIRPVSRQFTCHASLFLEEFCPTCRVQAHEPRLDGVESRHIRVWAANAGVAFMPFFGAPLLVVANIAALGNVRPLFWGWALLRSARTSRLRRQHQRLAPKRRQQRAPRSAPSQQPQRLVHQRRGESGSSG